MRKDDDDVERKEGEGEGEDDDEKGEQDERSIVIDFVWRTPVSATTTCQGAGRETSICLLMMSLHTVHTVHTWHTLHTLHVSQRSNCNNNPTKSSSILQYIQERSSQIWKHLSIPLIKEGFSDWIVLAECGADSWPQVQIDCWDPLASSNSRD